MKMVTDIPASVKREIVHIVLQQTRFENRHHVIGSRRYQEIAATYALEYSVYCCISPVIKIRRKEASMLPYGSKELTIDLREFSEGKEDCEHEGIALYWEEGGGGLDSGTPYTYKMCRLCGFHEKPFQNAFKRLFGSLLSSKQKNKPKYFERV